jgi:transposase
MKPYSLDFREKIIDAYYIEGVSQRQLAKRFRVSLSFVENLLKRLRETGDILPKPHGGGHPPKLQAKQLMLVKALVEADNDATLEELCEQLQQQTQILVSRSTMGRMVQALQLTRKKKHSMRPSRKLPVFNAPVSTTGPQCARFLLKT